MSDGLRHRSSQRDRRYLGGRHIASSFYTARFLLNRNALVTSGDVVVEFHPLQLRALQRQSGHAGQFVVGVFQHIG